jgi:hypothetical protein
LIEIPIFTSDSSSNGEKYQPCGQHAPLIFSKASLSSGQASAVLQLFSQCPSNFKECEKAELVEIVNFYPGFLKTTPDL